MIDEAEANASWPESSSSMALSCSTSEYIVMFWKGEPIRPCSTALAMVPMPACSGSNSGPMRPAATSPSRNAITWPAIACVSASGGKAFDGLSGLSVMTMAAMRAGSMAMAVLPRRWSTRVSGIGSRPGKAWGT